MKVAAGIEGAELSGVDQVRLEANKYLNAKRKVELGQFMTPDSVARFMASTVIDRDFIQDAVYRIKLGNKGDSRDVPNLSS